MPTSDRRRHRRLEIQLPLELRWRAGSGDETILRTITRNVSTGGLYFETDVVDMQPSQPIDVELTIPPGGGVSAFEGRATATAEVVRVVKVPRRRPGGLTRFGVGAQFRDRLRLRY